MIWLNPEELSLELNKSVKSIYILCGNNLSLLRNSQLNILKTANSLFHLENFNIKLNHHFDWNEIFNLCKITPLFSTHKILSFHFEKSYPDVLLHKNIPLLCSLIHNNLTLILMIYMPTQFQQQYRTWIQFFNKISITFVNCMNPSQKKLITWIQKISKNMNITIEYTACQLLLYYYEGNYGLLQQTLHYLSLVYPNKHLNCTQIKKTITDSAFFDTNNWIEAILTGNKPRANRILKTLIYIGIDFNILLHKIQHEILIIIQIKHNLEQNKSLYTLFKKHKIHIQHHRLILLTAIKRLNLNQLNKSISFLVQIELNYYKNNIHITQESLKLLTEILCN